MSKLDSFPEFSVGEPEKGIEKIRDAKSYWPKFRTSTFLFSDRAECTEPFRWSERSKTQAESCTSALLSC